MPQLFYENGAPIPDAEVSAAIAADKAFAKPGEQVAVRDVATGRIGRIDPADLGNPNYQPLTDAEIHAERVHQERGTLGQKGITALEGAARGASLGLSDVALTGTLGDEYRQSALERKEENPRTAIASELAGVVAPALLTGGAAAEAEGLSLAARAARVASAPVRAVSALGGALEGGAARAIAGVGGESLLARAGRSAISHAVGGAAEGAVFGAGSALSESALKGEPLTSEAMVASLGRNALFGGAIGAGMGALGKLAPAALNKALPSSEKLDETAVKFARKQLGRDFENVGKGQSHETAEAWKSASAKQLLERKLVGGDNAGKTIFEASTKPEDIAANLGQMRRDIGAEIGAARERAAAAIEANPAIAPNPEELLAQVDDYIAKLRKTKVAGNYSLARTAEREVAPLRKALAERNAVGLSPGATAAEEAGVGFDEAAARAGNIAKESGHSEALDKFLNQERRSVSEAERSGAANDTSSGVNRFLREAQGRGAVYDGPVYRGTNPEELEQLAKTGRVGHTLSVSQDIEGAGHFAKKGGVLLEIKDHPVPVDGIEGSNTFSEALIPKDSAAHIVGERVENGTRIVTVQMGAPGRAVPGSVIANDVSPSMGYRQLLDWQQALEKSLNPAGVAKSMRGLAVKNFGAKQEVSNIANNFLKDTTARALTAAGEDGSVVQRLHQEYAGTMAMQQAAEKESARILKNRHVSLTDHMLGIGHALMAMASGNMGALSAMGLGGAAAIGNKMLREQGNAAVAQIARKLASHNNVVEEAAKALALPAGLSRRAAGLAATAETRRSDYVPLGTVALTKDFDEARARVRELGTPDHMQAQLAHATGSVAEGYPEVAAGMSQRLMAVQDYLAKSIPEGEAPSVMTPLARAAGVEPRQMQKWVTKVNAALDPMQVIRDVARGKMDYDAVQTVKDVYPETFNQLRDATIRYTAANQEQLPYSRVVHLSDVFGFDGDSSLTPARISGLQVSIQQISAPPNTNAPGTPGQTKRARPSSAQSNKLGKPYNLPGQSTPGD